MKTRIFALLLAVVCLFAFAACKETPPAETPDTAYSLYTAANEQLAKLRDGADMDIKVNVAMNVGGMENSTTMSMTYKVCGNNMYGKMAGETMTYVDGILYTLSEYDLGEGPEIEKVKAEATPEEVADYFEGIVATLPTVTEEALANVTWTEENGVRTFALPIAKEDYTAALVQMMGAESDDFEGSVIDNLTVSISFDATDHLVALTYGFSMTEEYVGSINYTFTITYNTLGSPVVITAPADADTYETMPEEDWGDWEDWEDEE
ncbi:MAG: hypothetical protein IIW78_02485 [Clostridia bacterium]|nr:hypothetical protein [Clostridia bacterium]